MARQGDNQIQPVARPVQAFIEPVRVSVAEPMRPAQLPAMRQPGVVQQGGTPNVQGVNAFETLAGNLEAFNRQLTPVLQSIGLQYADNQMRQGEAVARAAALKGLAQNDAAMENAELNRAAANRSLAKKDPQAAGIMALLNPYRQVGYERGLAKVAGGEVAIGLPEAIRQRIREIDYLAPDQGQGQVRRIADEYSTKLMTNYGLTAESPAFQRYVAPEIEKAREKVGLQIAKDRQEYLDAKAIESTAAQMRNTYYAAMSSKTVEYNGATYTLTGDPQQAAMFNSALKNVLQGQLDRATQTGALPGDGRKRQKEIFKTLDKLGWGSNDGLRRMIGSLESTDAVLDEKGKPIIDPATGKPARLVLSSVYMDEDLEIRFRLGAARREEQKAAREGLMIQDWQFEDENGRSIKAPAFEAYLWERVGKLPPGEERNRVADAAVAEYHNKYGAGLARNGTTLLALEKKRKEILDLKSNIYFEGQPDPGLVERELAAMAQRRGDKWNAAAEYGRVEMIAQHYRDPQEANKVRSRLNDAIRAFDKDNTNMAPYKEARDAVINQTVNQGLNTYYGPSDRNNDGDRSVSRSRQWQAYVPHINAVLMQEEGKKGSKLTDAEVRRYTLEALTKYGSGPNGAEQKAYLFPGSKYTNVPGVTPKTKMGAAAGDMGPFQAGPGPTKPAPYSGKVYEINGLDSIPDRKILLRQYEKLPVLSAPALNQLIEAAAQGKPWPKAFEKAWRDSGAQNGGQFILKQIEKYQDNQGNPVFNLPPELQQKILKQAAAGAGAGDYVVSQRATAQRFPNLAILTGAALDLVTGARPASAAVSMESPGGGVGRNWSASTSEGAALVRVADRLGVSPADLAAIFSFETGGTLSPSTPGRGAAAGRVGLIQAGPNEMRAYGIHGGQTFEQQLEGVARYMKARGVRPGMGLPDLYAAVNGGNAGAGWVADGNGTVARSEATQRRLREHRAQAIRRLGLSPRN
jgi:hypothetical protein